MNPHALSPTPGDLARVGATFKALADETRLELCRECAPDLGLVNVSAVVTLDAPKLGPHRRAIQARLAELLALEPEAVGLTFKTSEGLAPDHVQARVTVLLAS